MFEIKSQEDLSQNLAATYMPVEPGPERRGSQIDADFEQVMRDGYIIIENLLTEKELSTVREACEQHLGQTGRNTFEGLKTQRVYNLLSKSRAFDRLAEHPRILGIIDKLFEPNYLLSQALVINIQPGEQAQVLHLDENFYKCTAPRPRMPVGVATVWAIDDFTETNGATAVVPGSHDWPDNQVPTPEMTIPAVMPAGSVVFFLGTTWHGGGANTSVSDRLAVTCQYCEPYLRTQANFSLDLSKETVAELSPELQSLVGYSIYPPFMGMVNGMHPLRLIND